jgi:hypothetical protein
MMVIRSIIIDMPGIVSSFCAPLAAAGVEMIYLSTFNTDLILVKEERVEEAYTHVKGSLAFLSAQVEEAARQRRIREQAIANGDIIDRKDNSSPPTPTPLTPVPAVIRTHHQTSSMDHVTSSSSSSTAANGARPIDIVSPNGSRAVGHSFAPSTPSAATINGMPISASPDDNDDGETRMHLSPLSTKLGLINFSKCHLPLCAHALLSIFLNPTRTEYVTPTRTSGNNQSISDSLSISSYIHVPML